jgi:hypothetical protein
MERWHGYAILSTLGAARLPHPPDTLAARYTPLNSTLDPDHIYPPLGCDGSGRLRPGISPATPLLRPVPAVTFTLGKGSVGKNSKDFVCAFLSEPR